MGSHSCGQRSICVGLTFGALAAEWVRCRNAFGALAAEWAQWLETSGDFWRLLKMIMIMLMLLINNYNDSLREFGCKLPSSLPRSVREGRSGSEVGVVREARHVVRRYIDSFPC